MYKTVVFLATTVALLFGFSTPALADFEPPDKIIVPKLCGKPEQWTVTSTVVFDNTRVAKPFGVGFVYGESSMPNGGIIPGSHNRRTPNELTMKTHSTGGYTIDLRSHRNEARIVVVQIMADGPNGSFWHREFNRDAVINTTRAGGCVSG